MPTRGSDSSEGTEERSPRRRTASRSSTTRPRTPRTRRTSSEDLDAVETRAPASDDDFGDGVEAEERPARRSESRRAQPAAPEDSAEVRPARRERTRDDAAATSDTEERRPRRPRAEAAGRSETSERGEAAGRVDRPVRGERRRRPVETTFEGDDRSESEVPREDRTERTERSARPPRGERSSERTERSERSDRADRTERVAEREPRHSDEERSPRESGGLRQLEFYSTDFDFNDQDDFSISDTSDEGDEGSREAGGDGDRRPRRRRRRRRRGGGGGADARGGDAPVNVDSRGGGDSQRGRGGRGSRGPGRNRRGGPGQGNRDSGGHTMGGGPRDRNRNMPRRSRPIQASGEPIEGTFDGVLELHPKGYGFLRDPRKNYAAEDSNPFVSSSLVEKYRLREGVLIRGEVGQGTRHQGPRLLEVETIDGFTPEEYSNIKQFDELTPINPFEQIKLETGPRPLTMRVMDLLCPIGKGQRALLVAPPRTGKTMLLQDIANSVSTNHPEIHLMVLLIDERPEEVTEMRRLVHGEVISSSLDNEVESHIRISHLIIERGKRLAEEGKDVFILLDSITRLARAYNKWSNSGRTATGGLDIRALDIPKKLFGTARRFDEGGSLTVCGTALIDTGSKMDEAIFQEFKGTGNMEMVLSRDLADRRIWPSIDVTKSGTRREEKILAPDVLEGTTRLRRSLITLSPVEAMEQLTRTMEKFPTNVEFLTKIRNVL